MEYRIFGVCVCVCRMVWVCCLRMSVMTMVMCEKENLFLDMLVPTWGWYLVDARVCDFNRRISLLTFIFRVMLFRMIYTWATSEWWINVRESEFNYFFLFFVKCVSFVFLCGEVMVSNNMRIVCRTIHFHISYVIKAAEWHK